MHKSTLSFFLILIPLLILGQQHSSKVYSTLDDGIKKEHYSEIKGSPYLFKDWVKADLIHLKNDPLKDVMIRYDLYEGNVEILDNGVNLDSENILEIDNEKFIVLEDNYYRKIVITRANNPKAFKDFKVDTLFLIKGIHKDYLRKYGVVLYDGKDVKLVRTFDIIFRESKINSPGKIEKIKKFNRKKGYALVIDKTKTVVKLKEKDFLKVLGKEAALKKYKKMNKLKLKKEHEFIELLKYFESLG